MSIATLSFQALCKMVDRWETQAVVLKGAAKLGMQQPDKLGAETLAGLAEHYVDTLSVHADGIIKDLPASQLAASQATSRAVFKGLGLGEALAYVKALTFDQLGAIYHALGGTTRADGYKSLEFMARRIGSPTDAAKAARALTVQGAGVEEFKSVAQMLSGRGRKAESTLIYHRAIAAAKTPKELDALVAALGHSPELAEVVAKHRARI